MLNKKTIEILLLEIEASCYNYEEYLNEIINEILINKKGGDIKYLIARENNYNYLTLYKYSQSDYEMWLIDNYAISNVDNFISELEYNNYSYDYIYNYVQQNYIDYYVEENILNFVNVTKFRKELYNNNSLLQKIKSNIITNIQNYSNNKYLINEYNLNKKLYKELLNIEKGTR